MFNKDFSYILKKLNVNSHSFSAFAINWLIKSIDCLFIDFDDFFFFVFSLLPTIVEDIDGVDKIELSGKLEIESLNLLGVSKSFRLIGLSTIFSASVCEINLEISSVMCDLLRFLLPELVSVSEVSFLILGVRKSVFFALFAGVSSDSDAFLFFELLGGDNADWRILSISSCFFKVSWFTVVLVELSSASESANNFLFSGVFDFLACFFGLSVFIIVLLESNSSSELLSSKNFFFSTVFLTFLIGDKAAFKILSISSCFFESSCFITIFFESTSSSELLESSKNFFFSFDFVSFFCGDFPFGGSGALLVRTSFSGDFTGVSSLEEESGDFLELVSSSSDESDFSDLLEVFSSSDLSESLSLPLLAGFSILKETLFEVFASFSLLLELLWDFFGVSGFSVLIMLLINRELLSCFDEMVLDFSVLSSSLSELLESDSDCFLSCSFCLVSSSSSLPSLELELPLLLLEWLPTFVDLFVSSFSSSLDSSSLVSAASCLTITVLGGSGSSSLSLSLDDSLEDEPTFSTLIFLSEIFILLQKLKFSLKPKSTNLWRLFPPY